MIARKALVEAHRREAMLGGRDGGRQETPASGSPARQICMDALIGAPDKSTSAFVDSRPRMVGPSRLAANVCRT